MKYKALFSDVDGTIVPVGPHTVPSDIVVNSLKEAKKYAARELARMLNIQTSEMIGVGDSGNDIPLLNACGLKIALGSATKDLKNVADYIAPTLANDGVSDVVNKFILK